MLEIYRTVNGNVHNKVEILIERKLGKGFEIKRTESGKPYIVGNPLYFSLSHSFSHAMIALCDKPVGIDVESIETQRKFRHVLSRFTKREQSCIGDSLEMFLYNWVSKEAYVKMKGGTLAHYLKRLEYYGDCLFADGKKADCFTARTEGLIYSVCAEGYTGEQIKLLNKGEII